LRAGLALRYSWKVWTGVWVAFLIIHYLLFGIVHNYVDMRPTIGYSPDPVMKIIPFDPRWSIISINLYIIMIAITTIKDYRRSQRTAVTDRHGCLEKGFAV